MAHLLIELSFFKNCFFFIVERPNLELASRGEPLHKFTFVLVGWEGLANDFTVLRDVVSQLQLEGLKIIADS